MWKIMFQGLKFQKGNSRGSVKTIHPITSHLKCGFKTCLFRKQKHQLGCHYLLSVASLTAYTVTNRKSKLRFEGRTIKMYCRWNVAKKSRTLVNNSYNHIVGLESWRNTKATMALNQVDWEVGICWVGVGTESSPQQQSVNKFKWIFF